MSTLQSSPSLIIGDAPVKQVNFTKSLAVYIDQILKNYIHIEKLCKKIAGGIGALKRTRPFVPGDTLLSIFNSLVQPAHFKIIVVLFGETVPKLCPPNFRNSKTVPLVL